VILYVIFFYDKKINLMFRCLMKNICVWLFFVSPSASNVRSANCKECLCLYNEWVPLLGVAGSSFHRRHHVCPLLSHLSDMRSSQGQTIYTLVQNPLTNNYSLLLIK
jgi:hypothetical protein